MKKFLIVSRGYPSNSDIYNNGFVHSRVKLYKDKGLDITVFSIVKNSNYETYNYDGVEVNKGSYKELENFLEKNEFSKILVHFGWRKTINTIIKKVPNVKLLVWVHGVEALGWYRRTFLFDWKNPIRFLGYMVINSMQLIFMHNFIRRKDINKKLIFVSEWMKDILEKDSFSKGKILNYSIIPNVVDENIFKYQEKNDEDRLNILSIRPYASKKYANDLSVEAVKYLEKEPFFQNLNFTFYGDGKLFDKTLEPIKKFKNVKIEKRFLNKFEIVEAHKNAGIMLIPTRQDAQGVSMCEAMMGGLVPVTSNNTAIPEYCNNEAGYLTNNSYELAEAIKEMYLNKKLFKIKSRKSHELAYKLCSSKNVISKEIDVIME